MVKTTPVTTSDITALNALMTSHSRHVDEQATDTVNGSNSTSSAIAFLSPRDQERRRQEECNDALDNITHPSPVQDENGGQSSTGVMRRQDFLINILEEVLQILDEDEEQDNGCQQDEFSTTFFGCVEQ